jgi:hypothetical protein
MDKRDTEFTRRTARMRALYSLAKKYPNDYRKCYLEELKEVEKRNEGFNEIWNNHIRKRIVK